MTKQPVVPTPEDLDAIRFTIPDLGCEVPEGWERADMEWFVDHSGWGQEWEPALTFDQFMDELRRHARENPTHGYGITDVGQFQLFVAAYRPVEADEPFVVSDQHAGRLLPPGSPKRPA